jgi:hypothetical protein
MKRAFRYSAWVAVSFAVVSLRAQQPAGPPPPAVLQIFEETVKVGKVPAHEKLETRWTKTLVDGKWPGQTLAMKTIAGAQQAWFVTPHESMASIEKLAKDAEKMTALTAQTDLLSAQDADLVSGVRSMFATYRSDISYLPANSVPVPKLRYFDVEIFQTRPGHTAEFIESRQLTKAAHEKAAMPDGMVWYAIVAGAPNGTFVRFRGLQSLADADRYDKAHTAKAYQDAAGATQKRIDELTSASVTNTQHFIFELDPKWSFMPKEFTAQDPEFWTPKPKATPSTAPAAEAQKPKAKSQ